MRGGRLARTKALVQLDERLLLGGRGVALEGAQHHLGAAEDVDDLVAGLGEAEGAQHQRGRLLALAVDAHGEHIALVGLELEPAAAARDDLRIVDELVRRAIMLGREVHAGRTDELRDDDALGAVDDEGALRGHHGEIAHEDFLLLDLARQTVDEADLGIQRSLIRAIALAAFLHRVLGLAEVVVAEFDAHILRRALDGADVRQRCAEALVLKPVEALGLDGDEVRDIHDRRDLRKAGAFPIIPVGNRFY